MKKTTPGGGQPARVVFLADTACFVPLGEEARNDLRRAFERVALRLLHHHAHPSGVAWTFRIVDSTAVSNAVSRLPFAPFHRNAIDSFSEALAEAVASTRTGQSTVVVPRAEHLNRMLMQACTDCQWESLLLGDSPARAVARGTRFVYLLSACPSTLAELVTFMEHKNSSSNKAERQLLEDLSRRLPSVFLTKGLRSQYEAKKLTLHWIDVRGAVSCLAPVAAAPPAGSRTPRKPTKISALDGDTGFNFDIPAAPTGPMSPRRSPYRSPRRGLSGAGALGSPSRGLSAGAGAPLAEGGRDAVATTLATMQSSILPIQQLCAAMSVVPFACVYKALTSTHGAASAANVTRTYLQLGHVDGLPEAAAARVRLDLVPFNSTPFNLAPDTTLVAERVEAQSSAAADVSSLVPRAASVFTVSAHDEALTALMTHLIAGDLVLRVTLPGRAGGSAVLRPCGRELGLLMLLAEEEGDSAVPPAAAMEEDPMNNDIEALGAYGSDVATLDAGAWDPSRVGLRGIDDALLQTLRTRFSSASAPNPRLAELEAQFQAYLASGSHEADTHAPAPMDHETTSTAPSSAKGAATVAEGAAGDRTSAAVSEAYQSAVTTGERETTEFITVELPKLMNEFSVPAIHDCIANEIIKPLDALRRQYQHEEASKTMTLKLEKKHRKIRETQLQVLLRLEIAKLSRETAMEGVAERYPDPLPVVGEIVKLLGTISMSMDADSDGVAFTAWLQNALVMRYAPTFPHTLNELYETFGAAVPHELQFHLDAAERAAAGSGAGAAAKFSPPPSSAPSPSKSRRSPRKQVKPPVAKDIREPAGSKKSSKLKSYESLPPAALNHFNMGLGNTNLLFRQITVKPNMAAPKSNRAGQLRMSAKNAKPTGAAAKPCTSRALVPPPPIAGLSSVVPPIVPLGPGRGRTPSRKRGREEAFPNEDRFSPSPKRAPAMTPPSRFDRRPAPLVAPDASAFPARRSPPPGLARTLQSSSPPGPPAPQEAPPFPIRGGNRGANLQERAAKLAQFHAGVATGPIGFGQGSLPPATTAADEGVLLVPASPVRPPPSPARSRHGSRSSPSQGFTSPMRPPTQ